MKKLLFTFGALLASITLVAQAPALNFHKDGRFKIAQLTDMHLCYGVPVEAAKTLTRLSNIIKSETPDLIVITGDVVTGSPAQPMWHQLVDSLTAYGCPYCIMLGNHDAEQDITRQQIAQIVTSSPLSLNTLNEKGELADRALPLCAKQQTHAVLYCMDSHDVSKIKNIEGYGWISREQVEWYRTQSKQYSAANGGKPIPALAFFHIPLREYGDAWRNPENTHIGRHAEDECPGALNSGLFTAMAESGDIIGVFVGHDHDDDYVVAENGIALGYGRYSGDNTVYNNLRHGIRIIIMKEDKRGFETWIHEDDGRIVDHARFEAGKITEM